MPTAKARILCTEDDADTRDLLILILSNAGFEVTPTDSADHALDLIRTQHFDLYLMDNWMPGVSGDDLCKKIREFDSKTPILFYSGAAYESDKVRARASGAQGYIVKPASDGLVAEVVRLIAESNIVIPIALVPPDECSML